MADKPTIRARQADSSPTLESGSVRAHCVHGQDLPAWLYQLLRHAQQEVDDGRLPAVLLLAGGQQDGLVVMTLHDFLRWNHTGFTMDGTVEEADASFHGRRNAWSTRNR